MYCCNKICPTVTSALGSALGYANYIEVGWCNLRPVFKAPLKLQHDKLLSIIAFNLTLRLTSALESTTR